MLIDVFRIIRKSQVGEFDQGITGLSITGLLWELVDM